MTKFLRLLTDKNKAGELLASCYAVRSGAENNRVFQVEPEAFRAVPGAPFAYWVSDYIRNLFNQLPAFESDYRTTKQGLATADDFRFLRLWWESSGDIWHGFAKGGAFSTFYSDVYLIVNWSSDGAEIKNNLNDSGGVRSNVWMLRDTATNFFGRSGLTWPRRTNGLSFRVMPAGCIFGDKGPAAFVTDDDPHALLALCAIVSSQAFSLLVSVQLARAELAQSFEVGLIQQTPIPELNHTQQSMFSGLASRAWQLKRRRDSVHETSHAFLLPTALHTRVFDYKLDGIAAELDDIHSRIDDIAFELYGFGRSDRRLSTPIAETDSDESQAVRELDDEGDGEEEIEPLDKVGDLLSWSVGVVFGRFDWRLATGERDEPPEPGPFDDLPAKSPGMLPDGAVRFHAHSGILVDDLGHEHDMPRLIEVVLERVDAEFPGDVRRWLQRDFFALHLKQYSKSRRKAPIYWPLSTTSGSYTLWVYYSELNDQTLYTAVNDFIEPKLKQVGRDAAALRDKGSARSRDDEKAFEGFQSLELELIELRDTLLRIAPTYQPNHDDGVQITAAPLWPLFTHKPWQKVLKDTWVKLEKGDYDWAHLAMAYWPNRVREKCRTDKSLTIAHGLEDLYEEAPVAKKKAGKKGADS